LRDTNTSVGGVRGSEGKRRQSKGEVHSLENGGIGERKRGQEISKPYDMLTRLKSQTEEKTPVHEEGGKVEVWSGLLENHPSSKRCPGGEIVGLLRRERECPSKMEEGGQIPDANRKKNAGLLMSSERRR